MSKTAASKARYYWDSCVLISFIEATPGRIETIAEFLEGAAAGKFDITTSVVSLTEVAFAESERAASALDPEVEARIDELWHPASPVRIYEMHELIALDARGLLRMSATRAWGLKPIDAIHLATAKRYGATVFHTYDGKLARWAPDVGFAIEAPQLEQASLFASAESTSALPEATVDTPYRLEAGPSSPEPWADGG
jgi:predicted nucleic acid-binding protein